MTRLQVVFLTTLLYCLTGQATAADLAVLRDRSGALSPFGRAVLRDFHGPDLRGKDGPLARLGLDLIVALHAHEHPRGPAVATADNPLLRWHGQRIAVDVTATGDSHALRDELVALGMQGASVFGSRISGYLPVASLRQAAALPLLQHMRPSAATRRAGSVTSQGDSAMQGPLARTTHAVDGSGITIGTLSDSFDCRGGAAGDVTSGDLPGGIVVLKDETGCTSGSDEGRAMMQIIHDTATGSSQLFHTAFDGEADFANGIIALASNGADIINDDVVYYAEPMFQDGIIAQAVDTVKAMGVAYFSSAGNDARHSYESPYSSSGVSGLGSGSIRHDFDPGGGIDSLQRITIGGGRTVIFVFQWSNPYFSVSGAPGATADMDIVIYSDKPKPIAQAGGIDNNIGGDPVEVFAFTNNGPTRTFLLAIDLAAGPAPALMKYVWFGDVTVDEFDTASSTAYGHSNAAGARSVGAARYDATPAFGTSPPELEWFSSAGGIPILFDGTGAPVNILRQKPEIVAPDGVDTTFFYPGQDYEPNGFPNFFGTSAAAPHAAAVAALLREADSTLTPDAVYTIMQDSAIDMGIAGVDDDSGHGLIQAAAALAMLDSDGDGVPDSLDLCPGTGNGQPVDGNGCSDFQIDSDGDGLSDGLENQIGTDPLVDDDFDGDGLSDFQEVNWNGDSTEFDPATDLDPLDPDTDGDGFADGMEYTAGYNPLLDTSYPVWADLNDDRSVNGADVVLALAAIRGDIVLSSAQLARGNVAPLVGGVPQPVAPDSFDSADLTLIHGKALGVLDF